MSDQLRFRPSRVTLACVLSLLLAACGWFQELPTAAIVNESGETLHLVGVNSDGVEVEIAVIEAGARYPEPLGSGDCVEPRLVVRTSDGDDYASRDRGTLCADEEWVITGPDQ